MRLLLPRPYNSPVAGLKSMLSNFSPSANCVTITVASILDGIDALNVTKVLALVRATTSTSGPLGWLPMSFFSQAVSNTDSIAPAVMDKRVRYMLCVLFAGIYESRMQFG